MSLLSLLLLACATTGSDVGTGDATTDGGAEVDESDLTVSLAPPAQGYQVVTEPYEVPPYTEVEVCSVVKLSPDAAEQLAWVDHMESLSSSGTHHMNVFIGQFSFYDAFLGDGASEDALGTSLGQYPCSELPTMEMAFPIFPSQRENQKITLPPGVAAPLPLPLVAVFSHHYVNTTDEPLTINAALNMSTLPADQVEHVAGMVFDAIGGLEIPPGTRKSYARTCVFEHETDVALVSSHNHEWGACATMNHVDGDSEQVEAEPFYVNKLWDQPPILHFEPGSFSMQPGDGVHWACHFENDTERTLVDDGTADGEMCVFAAVTWPSPFDVEEVEEIVAKRDLGRLLELMDQVLGGCDSTRDDLESPWTLGETDPSGEPVCADFEQTESNTLY